MNVAHSPITVLSLCSGIGMSVMLTRDQRRYRADKAAGRDRAGEWRRDNPERAKELSRICYQNTRGNRLKAAKRQAEKERLRGSTPAQRLADLNRKHARRSSTPLVERLTAAQWVEILERHNHCCAYCGSSVAKLTQDHVVAISRGGKHVAGNVVPACNPCNASKGVSDKPKNIGRAA